MLSGPDCGRSLLFLLQWVILLTRMYWYFKPVFRGHRRTRVIFAVHAPGIVCFVEVENPFPFSSLVSVRFKIEIPPCAIRFLARCCITEGNKQPLLRGIASVNLNCLLLVTDLEPELPPSKEISLFTLRVSHPQGFLFSMLTEFEFKSIHRVGREIIKSIKFGPVFERNREAWISTLKESIFCFFPFQSPLSIQRFP